MPSMIRRLSLLSCCLIGIVLLITIVLTILESPTQISGAQRLTQAEFSLTAQDGSWQPSPLPDSWDLHFTGYGGFAWYKLHLKLAEMPKALWGVYLPKLSMNAEVYINGTLAGSGGSMEEPVSRYWNLPLYIQVPPSLFRKGDNDIHIRLRGFANGRAGLSPIFIGPDTSLFSAYRTRFLRSHELSVGAFAVNMTLGLILLIWWIASRDAAFLWFAMGSLISCVYILDSFWVDTPLFRLDWRWMTHAAVAWSMCFYYLFMLRMLKHPVGWFERSLLIYTFVGALLLRLADNAHQLPFALILHLGGLSIMLHLIWISFSGWLREGKYLHLWLGACMLQVAAFGFADWIPVAFHIEKKTPYIYYLGPVAFSLAVSLVLLTRFLNSLAAEKNFTHEMRVSLEQQKKMLDTQHQKISELQREMAVSDERTRIMRELHDGLGGHLVGALSLSEQQGSHTPISHSIHHALDELRIMMDSLDNDTDVLTMLGMLRQRIEQGLKQAGIKLKWISHCKPSGLHESSKTSLHIMRIVQEAINNSMRHANPTLVTFRINKSGLCIADNGHGFIKDKVSSGRGLNNLKWRAKKIGARVQIRTSKRGTIVNLRF